MRNLFIILLVIIALAVLRGLVNDVIKAVKKATSTPGRPSPAGSSREDQAPHAQSRETGHLVKDPISGTYIDQSVAVQEEIDGKVFFFESHENRDEYVKRARAGRT